MRKAISLFCLALVALLVFSGCGASKRSIEAYEWQMSAVMRNQTGVTVAANEADIAHPEAAHIDMRLTAKDGKFTMTDHTNEKSYHGTYTMESKNAAETLYRVTMDGKDGYATVAMTEYEDGSEKPTMPINLGEYSIYFYAK